ncbi:MAG TPA: MYXO-CTERM sorting domain-containing protein, partial [Planctomycetota bacterium]|nr:MYXO-CTERM sorting domain-containing protein [Planctomycetota bacterium]
YDPNGGALTYTWSASNAATNQPLASTVFSNPNAVAPLFTPGTFGTFNVTLVVAKVSDPTSIATATIQVTLANPAALPPTANAGPDQVILIGTQVILNGSASSTQQGTLTYAWTPVSEPEPVTLSNPTAVSPTFTPNTVGTYVIQLVVSNGTATSQPSVVHITVISTTNAQQGPAAEPRAAGLVYGCFLTAAPAGNLTTTPPTLILEDGTKVAAVTSATGTNAQNLTDIKVFVANNPFATVSFQLQAGAADPARVQFDTNTSAPVLAWGVTSQSFILDGTRSHDTQVINAFDWTCVSAPAGFTFGSQQGSLIAVVPPSPGLYVFTLTVVDNIGLSSFPRTIYVPVVPAAVPNAGPPQPAITASAGATVLDTPSGDQDLVVAASGNSVTLDAGSSVSHNGGALSFDWTQLAGPIALLTNQTTPTLGFAASTPGAYELELTVTDANGTSVEQRVWITVPATGKAVPTAVVQPVQNQTLPSSGSVTLTLDGSRSTGTGTLAYYWTQIRGTPTFVNSTSNGTGTVTVTQPGAYEFALRVSDGTVTSAPTVVAFEVASPAQQALPSGASISKSSGGCAVGAAGGEPWSLAPFALFALVIVTRRRRGAK